MRLANWPQILAQEIEAARTRPFAWGSADCALFVADVVLAMTGHDYAADLRGYTGRAGAMERIADAGSLEQLVAGLLGEPWPVNSIGRGDVVLIDTPKGEALGICLGTSCAFAGPKGLEFLAHRDPRRLADRLMPPVIAAVAGAIGGFFLTIGVPIVTAYAIGAAAYTVISTLAINAVISLATRALSGRPKGAQVADTRSRDITITNSVAPRPIIFGQIRASGVLAFVGTAGSRNEYLDYVICLTGHQVEAIDDVWFDNIQIPNSDWNSGTGAVTGGQFAGKASIWKYLGTDAQTVDPTITADYTEWDSTHRLRGVAYLVIRLTLDDKIWPNGPPQNFYALVKGARVYDPRLDSTNGGSGSHRVADPTTWAYSNNAALCQASYLIGGSIVFDTSSAALIGQLGFGASSSDIDWATVAAAANVCDENVTIPPASPTTTQKRYTCDGMLATSNTLADNMEQLLTASVGQLVYSSGKYKLYAGSYQAPSISLTPDDLAGQLELVSGVPRSERYNSVQGVYWSSVSWSQVPFFPRVDTTYETRDGGRRLVRDIDLPFTTDEYRAQRIAELLLNQSDNQQILKWPGQISASAWGSGKPRWSPSPRPA